jgi:hypothetical protein
MKIKPLFGTILEKLNNLVHTKEQFNNNMNNSTGQDTVIP